MPPKKKPTKAAQLHPQAAQSDYDTDTANVTDAPAIAPPPPPDRTITELNLLVLRRYLPGIERIISIAPFSAVYQFSPESLQWEKSGTEGPLFVCQLSAEATGHHRYSVFILNRKSLDNFLVELTSGENVQLTEEYVMLQVPGEEDTPSIYGLWILPDEQNAPGTRDLVANAIQECAVRAERGKAQTQNGHVPSPSYNLDGAADTSMDENMTPVDAQSTGQAIDLNSLFSRPALPAQDIPQHPSIMGQRFTPHSDTDFFRGSSSPASLAQQQQTQPSQQNALLDIFKSAKKG